ncbi:MAG: hypothetical protein GY864_11790 [Desulfobacterales bacterium]|nr:hypothetical protein [Desulfobacterales bacterium]
MMRFLMCLSIAISILVGSSVKAKEKEPLYIKANNKLFLEGFLYSPGGYFNGLEQIERFAAVSVSLEGSAEKMGLDEKHLADYARLRFRNTFSDMNLEKSIKIIDEERSETGIIYIKIYTTRVDSIIAYHVFYNVATFSSEFLIDMSCLGIASQNEAPNKIKKAISGLMDRLAIRFHKDKGGM